MEWTRGDCDREHERGHEKDREYAGAREVKRTSTQDRKASVSRSVTETESEGECDQHALGENDSVHSKPMHVTI